MRLQRADALGVAEREVESGDGMGDLRFNGTFLALDPEHLTVPSIASETGRLGADAGPLTRSAKGASARAGTAELLSCEGSSTIPSIRKGCSSDTWDPGSMPTRSPKPARL